MSFGNCLVFFLSIFFQIVHCQIFLTTTIAMTRVDFLNSLCCFFLYHFVNISLCFKKIYILYSRLASFKVSKRAALIIKHTDERFYGNRTTMYYFVTCICKAGITYPQRLFNTALF